MHNHGGVLSYVVVAQTPLPPPEKVYQDVFNMAWPQVLAWCSAAVGLILVYKVIRAFIAR